VGVPNQCICLSVPLQYVRLNLVMAVVGAEPAGDRLSILVAVVDRCLLEGEQVKSREVLGLLD
jgi:hypothetical protein